MNLLTDVEVRRILNVASGSQNCVTVDMEGFDEVTFVLIPNNASNGTGSLVINQGDAIDPATASVAEITGVVNPGQKPIILTVTQPMHRYLRAIVTEESGTFNAAAVLAILSKARTLPTVQSSTNVAANAIFQSPEMAAV